MAFPVRHVCLFRLKRPMTADESKQLNDFSSALRGENTAILKYVFTSNQARKNQGFSLVLYSEFATNDAIRDYVKTPLHDALAAFMDGFVEETVVADF